MAAYSNAAEVNVNVQPHDSLHVMAATNVRRGMTPATWDATDAAGIAGKWLTVDAESGPADCSGNVTGKFLNDGTGAWKQT
jgi:hypothetical protein